MELRWSFRKVAIVGSGAIGLYYGGRLAQAGEDVTFLARSDYDVLKKNGLSVESIHGDFHVPHVKVQNTALEIGPVDLVIVAWKATSNAYLAEVLAPLLHENTQVLTLQNGLGNCELISRIVGPSRVLGGLCFVCINRTAAGQIVHLAGGKLSIGEWLPDSLGRAGVIENHFKAANVPAQAVGNLVKSQWEKLLWNIPFNGLSVAEGGVTTDMLLTSPATEQAIRELMKEVQAAARALGYDIEDDLIEQNIERTRPMGAYRTSSMIDFVEGRELEIEPIWGEPLRRAVANGVGMPRTAAMLQKIRARINEARSPL